jgi:Domain of unknown function (DUF1772)
MTVVLEILTLLSVSITMALALAHALEYPGKVRLSRQDYETVQEIYYPGFTYGGVSEGIGLLLLLVLLLLAPGYGAAFWLMLAAFLALSVMHAVYWLFIHPINSFWLKDFELKGFAARFFGFGTGKGRGRSPDWTDLRDRWEYAHIARAALGMLALMVLAAALIL